MTTCNSESIVSTRESCGIECIDYEFTDKKEMAKNHDICVEKCINKKANEPSPIGCFVDAWNRDLKKKLGADLTTE